MIEYVCFRQRIPLDICFENRDRWLFYVFLMLNIAKKEKNRKMFLFINFRLVVNTTVNLHFKKAKQLTPSQRRISFERPIYDTKTSVFG
jgi:hypothetical protein